MLNFEEKRKETFQFILNLFNENDSDMLEIFDKLLFNQHNAENHNIYTGYNRILLNSIAIKKQLKDNRWLTFNQIKKLKLKLKKGAKAAQIEKWSLFTPKEKEGEKDKEIQPIPFLKYFFVFNASDIEGLPPLKKSAYKLEIFDLIADNLQNSSVYPIVNNAINQPEYVSSIKLIKMPLKEQFINSKSYLSTLVQMISKATISNNQSLFKKENLKINNYENLISIISTLIFFKNFDFPLGDETFNNFSLELKKWLPYFKENYKLLYSSIKDSEKIANQILENYERKQIA